MEMEELLQSFPNGKIDLSNHSISGSDVVALVNWIQMSKPSEVILSGCRLTDAFLQEIIECCAANENLRVLGLSNNLLDELGCRSLLTLLHSNKCVESVNILNNPILKALPGVGSHPLLSRLLKLFADSRYLRSVCGCTILQPTLVLRSVHFEQEVDVIICELKKNTDLKSLQCIGNQNTQQLLVALDSNKSLVRLALDGFHVPSQLSSTSGLSCNTSLQTLQIRWNDNSTKKDAETLMLWLHQNLHKNSCLTTLQMDFVPLDRDLFDYLAEILRYNRSLIHLALFNLVWLEEDKLCLLASLRKNPVLRVLHIAGSTDAPVWNDVDHDVMANIALSRGSPLILRLYEQERVYGQLNRQAADDWAVGDVVEALFNDETWMEGQVIAVSVDYKYSMLFANGQVKNNFRGNRIRRGESFSRPGALTPLIDPVYQLAQDEDEDDAANAVTQANALPTYSMGQSVVVRYYGDSLWYPAVVQGIACDFLFTVQMEDKSTKEVERHLISPSVPYALPYEASAYYDIGYYQRGDYVDVLFSNDDRSYPLVWKRGRVAHDNRDGSYYVRLENNTDMPAVRGRDMRFHFRAKDVVDVRSKDGVWCNGKILKPENTGYYVKYDGFEEMNGQAYPISYQEHAVVADRIMPSGRGDVRAATIAYAQKVFSMQAKYDIPAIKPKSGLVLDQHLTKRQFKSPDREPSSARKEAKARAQSRNVAAASLLADDLSRINMSAIADKTTVSNRDGLKVSDKAENESFGMAELEAREMNSTSAIGVITDTAAFAETYNNASKARSQANYRIGMKVQVLLGDNHSWINAIVSEVHQNGTYTVLLLDAETEDGGGNVHVCTEDMIRLVGPVVENSFERTPQRQAPPPQILKSTPILRNKSDNASSLKNVRSTRPADKVVQLLKEGMRINYFPEGQPDASPYEGIIEQVHRGNSMYTIAIADGAENPAVITVPAHTVIAIRPVLARSPDVRKMADALPAALPTPHKTIPNADDEMRRDDNTCDNVIGRPLSPTPPSSRRTARSNSFNTGHRQIQENLPNVVSGNECNVSTDINDRNIADGVWLRVNHSSHFNSQCNVLVLQLINSDTSRALDGIVLDIELKCVFHSRKFSPNEAPVAVHAHVSSSMLDVQLASATTTLQWSPSSYRAILPVYFSVNPPDDLVSFDNIQVSLKIFNTILLGVLTVPYLLRSDAEVSMQMVVESKLWSSIGVCEVVDQDCSSMLSDKLCEIKHVLPSLRIDHAVNHCGDAQYDSVQVVVADNVLQQYSWDDLQVKFNVKFPSSRLTVIVLCSSSDVHSASDVSEYVRLNPHHPIVHLGTISAHALHAIAMSSLCVAPLPSSVGLQHLKQLVSQMLKNNERVCPFPDGMLMLPVRISDLCVDTASFHSVHNSSNNALLHGLRTFVDRQLGDGMNAGSTDIPELVWHMCFMGVGRAHHGVYSSAEAKNEASPALASASISVTLELLSVLSPVLKLSVASILLGVVDMVFNDRPGLMLLFDFFDILDQVFQAHRCFLTPSWASDCRAKLAEFRTSVRFNGPEHGDDQGATPLEGIAQKSLLHPLLTSRRKATVLLTEGRKHLDRVNPHWTQQCDIVHVRWSSDGEIVQCEWVCSALWNVQKQLFPCHSIDGDGREIVIALASVRSSLIERTEALLPAEEAATGVAISDDIAGNLTSHVGLKDSGHAHALSVQMQTAGCYTWQEFLDIYPLISEQPGVTAANIGDKLKGFFVEDMLLPKLVSLKLAAFLVKKFSSC